MCYYDLPYYSDPDNDRSWEYRCSSGGGLANVTTNCSLQVRYTTKLDNSHYHCVRDICERRWLFAMSWVCWSDMICFAFAVYNNWMSHLSFPQANINAQYGTIDYDCPAGGYVGGFQSTFSPTDRTWSVNCCTRQHATLVNCAIPTTIWENSLENVLNWTASGGRVLTGIQSFYSPFNRLAKCTRHVPLKFTINCLTLLMQRSEMAVQTMWNTRYSTHC